MASIFTLQFSGLEKADKIKTPKEIDFEAKPSSSQIPSPPILTDNLDSIAQDIQKQTRATQNNMQTIIIEIRGANRLIAFAGYASAQVLTAFFDVNKSIATFATDLAFISIAPGVSASIKGIMALLDSIKLISELYNASKQVDDAAQQVIDANNKLVASLVGDVYNLGSTFKEKYKQVYDIVKKSFGFTNLAPQDYSLAYINIYNYTKTMLEMDIALGEQQANSVINSILSIDEKKELMPQLEKNAFLYNAISSQRKIFEQIEKKDKKLMESVGTKSVLKSLIIDNIMASIQAYLQYNSEDIQKYGQKGSLKATLDKAYKVWHGMIPRGVAGSLGQIYKNLDAYDINDIMYGVYGASGSLAKNLFSPNAKNPILDVDAQKELKKKTDSLANVEKLASGKDPLGRQFIETIDALLSPLSEIAKNRDLGRNYYKIVTDYMLRNKKIKHQREIEFDQYISFPELNQRNQLQFVVNFPNKSVNLYHHSDDFKRDKERVRHIFDDIFKQMKKQIQWN